MATAIDTRFDCYYTYDEMTAQLHSLVAAYPGLASMRSLAKTFGGRDVWLIDITNHAKNLATTSTHRYTQRSTLPAPPRSTPSGTC
jgi:antibiotic biosynthesis monooxygenase (ABM) superfamily enzyme